MTLKKTVLITIISMVLIGTASIAFANGSTEARYGAGGGMGYGHGAGKSGGYGNANGVGQGENRAAGRYNPEEHDAIEDIIAGIDPAPLNEEEQADLLYMREEEKLARDVYSALYDMYGIPVFRNIAESEQAHMDSLAVLIERYGLSDPVGIDTAGVFVNQELQELYKDLVEQGGRSLLAAAEVGAAVEELDIADLDKALAESDNDDMRIVYQNLQKGSRNHLRSFTMQIERQGGDYSPVYLSEAEARAIVDRERETGTNITDPEYRYIQ